MSIPKFGRKAVQFTCIAALLAGLSACEDGEFKFPAAKSADTDAAVDTATAETDTETQQRFVEKDVESPEVFSKSEKALWDGRPSLGGVWVAHADVTTPERILIRNQANGKKVIGALFRRERVNPGPSLQLSSDAADALGIVAGVPVVIDVVAMRKKKIPVGSPKKVATPNAVEAAPAPEIVESDTLGPIAASTQAVPASEAETVAAEPPKRKGLFGRKSKKARADAAIAAGNAADGEILASAPVEAATGAATTVAATAPAALTGRPMLKPLPRPETGLKRTAAAKPTAPDPTPAATGRYVQMGFFSVRSNADGTLAQLKSNGLSGKIVASDSNGTKFWRVLAGPAQNSSAENNLLQKVKAMGFADAYLVKG